MLAEIVINGKRNVRHVGYWMDIERACNVILNLHLFLLECEKHAIVITNKRTSCSAAMAAEQV
jgi:hypothetical protein